MAMTVKTIIKLFAFFLFYQIMINTFIQISPSMVVMTEENADYLTFLKSETNLIDGTGTGESLLDDFVNSLETEDLFNDGILNSFIGLAKIIADIISFIVEIALLILITPSILINIWMYGFVGASSVFAAMTLIANIIFYMVMFWIVFRGRTQN